MPCAWVLSHASGRRHAQTMEQTCHPVRFAFSVGLKRTMLKSLCASVLQGCYPSACASIKLQQND
jgi:hypothetical protein